MRLTTVPQNLKAPRLFLSKNSHQREAVVALAANGLDCRRRDALVFGNDFRKALESALDCGGDTDTVGAIVGAIVGAKVGKEGLPPELIAGVCEWPRSISLLEKVAARLSQQKDTTQALGPIQYFWPGLIVRNFIFLVVVLIHGFRRLVPPF